MRKILLCGLLLSTLACEKKAQEHSRGPQSSKSAIEALQRAYTSKFDPYTIDVGQKVHRIETQEVITSQAPIKNLSKEIFIEVTELENFSDERLITTLRKVNDKITDANFTYEFKNVYSLPQLSSFQLMNQLSDVTHSIHTLTESLMEQSTKKQEIKIKGIAYHNLKTHITTLKPPQLVQESPDCAGLKDCKINADKLTFDIVFLLSNGKTQVSNVEWFFSSEVPYFAGILKQCATTLIPVDNARALVKQCNEVVNFNP